MRETDQRSVRENKTDKMRERNWQREKREKEIESAVGMERKS